MKRCDYCGGNAESGCGAVETAAGLYLHYSKIECAELLKLQVETLLKGQPITRADVREEIKLKAEIDAALLQIHDYQNVVTLAVIDLDVAQQLGVASNRVESAIRMLREVLVTAGKRVSNNIPVE